MINPIIQIGPLAIHWYGIILAAAILLGYFIARKNSWKFGISQADVDDFSFWLVIVGLLGARAYYVLFNWDFFSQNFTEVYKLWHGGISIYGAILSGIVFTYFYARKKAYSFWQLADLLALALPLAQAVGRFGNFVNQEAYGTPTNLPWKIYVHGQYVHPTFLYEAIANLLIFCLVYRLIGKSKPGIIALTYLMAYSFIRFFIEALRTDSQFLYGFRVDQLTAFFVIIISGILMYRKIAKIA